MQCRIQERETLRECLQKVLRLSKGKLKSGKLTPVEWRLSRELCGVMGDASDSDRGGYPMLPLPADDAGDAVATEAAMTAGSWCW